MIVGQSGSGKTTFINTLCESILFPPFDYSNPEKAALPKTVKINPVSIDLEEDGVKLSLTLIDTPGYGDSISNTANFDDLLSSFLLI